MLYREELLNKLGIKELKFVFDTTPLELTHEVSDEVIVECFAGDISAVNLDVFHIIFHRYLFCQCTVSEHIFKTIVQSNIRYQQQLFVPEYDEDKSCFDFALIGLKQFAVEYISSLPESSNSYQINIHGEGPFHEVFNSCYTSHGYHNPPSLEQLKPILNQLFKLYSGLQTLRDNNGYNFVHLFVKCCKKFTKPEEILSYLIQVVPADVFKQRINNSKQYNILHLMVKKGWVQGLDMVFRAGFFSPADLYEDRTFNVESIGLHSLGDLDNKKIYLPPIAFANTQEMFSYLLDNSDAVKLPATDILREYISSYTLMRDNAREAIERRFAFLQPTADEILMLQQSVPKRQIVTAEDIEMRVYHSEDDLTLALEEFSRHKILCYTTKEYPLTLFIVKSPSIADEFQEAQHFLIGDFVENATIAVAVKDRVIAKDNIPQKIEHFIERICDVDLREAPSYKFLIHVFRSRGEHIDRMKRSLDAQRADILEHAAVLSTSVIDRATPMAAMQHQCNVLPEFAYAIQCTQANVLYTTDEDVFSGSEFKQNPHLLLDRIINFLYKRKVSDFLHNYIRAKVSKNYPDDLVLFERYWEMLLNKYFSECVLAIDPSFVGIKVSRPLLSADRLLSQTHHCKYNEVVLLGNGMLPGNPRARISHLVVEARVLEEILFRLNGEDDPAQLLEQLNKILSLPLPLVVVQTNRLLNLLKGSLDNDTRLTAYLDKKVAVLSRLEVLFSYNRSPFLQQIIQNLCLELSRLILSATFDLKKLACEGEHKPIMPCREINASSHDNLGDASPPPMLWQAVVDENRLFFNPPPEEPQCSHPRLVN